MRIFRTHVENAVESLNANRMRTFLTMLGVIIGIASITAIFSLSGGLSNIISTQVQDEGGALLVVRPKEMGTKNKDFISSLASPNNFVKSSLSENDSEVISKTENVVASAPLALFNSEIKAEGNSIESGVLATNPNLEKVINLKTNGEFIAESANTTNAVVGYQFAVDLFGTPEVVGRTMKIKGQSFLIIGVLEKQKSAINFSNIDFNNVAIINFSSAKNITGGNLQIQQINARIDSVNNLKAVDSKVEAKILENHKDEKDFEVFSGDEISHPSGDVFTVVSHILVLVAGISLVVGGIGIMNIMLVNVSERTREIGIRKALGANNRQILMQFLTESMIISVGGGIFGFILGYTFSFGASMILPFKPAISYQSGVIIFALSVIVGVFFGLYPAIRASRKDPIESLRHYN